MQLQQQEKDPDSHVPTRIMWMDVLDVILGVSVFLTEDVNLEPQKMGLSHVSKRIVRSMGFTRSKSSRVSIRVLNKKVTNNR